MTTTTTAVPTISRRLEDGTWRSWDVTITPWQFSAEDGAGAQTLTEWLRDFLDGEGEGVWAADYGDVESEVVCTGPTTEDVYKIAAYEAATPEAVELVADECGSLTLVSITAKDGTVMVVGPEREGGYVWSTYSAAEYDEQPLMERYLTTDGDSTIATLADAIREQVG